METNGKNDDLVREVSVETIKEEIREIRNKKIREISLINKSNKIRSVIMITIGVLGVLAAYGVLILHLVFGDNNDSPIKAICLLVAILVIVVSSVPLVNHYDHTLNKDLWAKEKELYEQLNEMVLGGRIVVGTLNKEWSEITIDKGDYMSKVMARLVGEEQLDIETRSIVLG